MGLFGGGSSGMMQMLGLDPEAINNMGEGLHKKMAAYDAQLNEIKQLLLVQNALIEKMYDHLMPEVRETYLPVNTHNETREPL